MSEYHLKLSIYTKCVSLFTLFLIFVGGMVTSTGSGLAVPDWPLSYGSLFPPMIGGVFYEHGHRMVASFVGLLTVILCLWIFKVETRSWVKVLGCCALLAVILQGILGGLTVIYFLPTPISVSHATLAQTFFLITLLIVYSQSFERRKRQGAQEDHHNPFSKIVLCFVGLIYVQLILGAIMRHTQSGLAIFDFPTMGGFWIPPFNDDMLARINDWRFDHDLIPVSLTQVVYHFIHRVGALLIVMAVCVIHSLGCKYYTTVRYVRTNLVLIDILLMIQICLGIFTVLSGKNDIITSLHVVNGAMFLGAAFILYLRVRPLRYNHAQ